MGHKVVQVFANPLNEKRLRTGSTTRAGEGGRRPARSGRDRGDLNSSQRYWRLVRVERAVIMSSGKKYPE